MNTDGSNQTQLTFREGGFPLFTSPDGKWIYYQSRPEQNALAGGG